MIIGHEIIYKKETQVKKHISSSLKTTFTWEKRKMCEWSGLRVHFACTHLYSYTLVIFNKEAAFLNFYSCVTFMFLSLSSSMTPKNRPHLCKCICSTICVWWILVSREIRKILWPLCWQKISFILTMWMKVLWKIWIFYVFV